MKTFTNAAFKEWQVLPRPPLSPWEGENCPPSLRETKQEDWGVTREKLKNVRLLFPLPQEKGQGPGELHTNPSAKSVFPRP